jgi:replicative DNA helicase
MADGKPTRVEKGPDSKSDILRIPPQSTDAEQSVLGGILFEERAITKVLDILVPSDFYRDAHRKIYSAMITLFEKNEPVDLITLTEALKKQDALDAAGGHAYISSLVDTIPTAANIQYYARIVKEKAILRNLITISSEIIAESYEDQKDVDDLLDRAESRIFEISEHKIRPSFFPMKEVVKESFKMIETLYEKKELITGVPTGFRDLDLLTSGFQPSDLIIIAGRPSMGKTALALNIARYASSARETPVLLFSLEMSKEQLAMRMLSTESRIDFNRIRSGRIRKDEWRGLMDAANTLSEIPIVIDDSASLNPLEMRAKARRLKAEMDIGMVIVDYLQLMTGMGRAERRDLEISEVSRSLKAMAKELNIPVVALSQLSRAVESRENKRPILADLRESGAIEQDADLIIFIYREELYKHKKFKEDDEKPFVDPAEEEKDAVAEIIIGKQRNGPTGTVRLAFLKEFTRFEDFSKRDEFQDFPH